MAQLPEQSFAKHTKWDPKFHFFLVPLLALLLLFSAFMVYRNPSGMTVGILVIVIALIVNTFITRIYSLRVQDRVIRLEERLRLASLLPAHLHPRIVELSESQLIALRFASDAELPAIAERTLNEKLSRDAIKRAIATWRADHWRV